ncbi:MAG: hypothetical protein SNJ55_07785 [Chloroherpetonaceae bacterium]
MKPSILFVGFFAALLFTGCAQMHQSTSEQPLAYIYNASSDHLFETTLATLQSQGFAITVADKQSGTIQTDAVKIDEQTALALFDKSYDDCNCKSFSIHFTIAPTSHDRSQLNIVLLSNERSNSILERTLLDNVAVKLNGRGALMLSKIDVSNAPIVSISMKDNSTVEGYLLDDTERGYLRLKLKSGGILHVERSEIERYTLASESASGRN